MPKPFKNKRRFSRVPLTVSMSVEIQQGKNKIRREKTHLIDISPVGAGFNLDREVAIGQLLRLKMPLPRGFRAYDFADRDYCVWSVVRHCRFEKENDVYVVGVAFIGETPPNGFEEKPLTLYELSNFNNSGFWEITENGFLEEASAEESEIRRPRYGVAINVYLAIYDETDTIIAHEQTVTENISRSGAAVFSMLPVKVGDTVSLMSEQYKVSLPAEVRDIRTGEDGLPRLHLKFTGAKFPLHGIE